MGHGRVDVLHGSPGVVRRGRDGRGDLPGVGWIVGLMGYGRTGQLERKVPVTRAMVFEVAVMVYGSRGRCCNCRAGLHLPSITVNQSRMFKIVLPVRKINFL